MCPPSAELETFSERRYPFSDRAPHCHTPPLRPDYALFLSQYFLARTTTLFVIIIKSYAGDNRYTRVDRRQLLQAELPRKRIQHAIGSVSPNPHVPVAIAPGCV